MADEGKLSPINNTLVMVARELVDKQPSPTAGVIYSQSVKTTKVAEYVAFMRGGRSTDASAT
jgi:hypothetical protein